MYIHCNVMALTVMVRDLHNPYVMFITELRKESISSVVECYMHAQGRRKNFWKECLCIA